MGLGGKRLHVPTSLRTPSYPDDVSNNYPAGGPFPLRHSLMPYLGNGNAHCVNSTFTILPSDLLSESRFDVKVEVKV